MNRVEDYLRPAALKLKDAGVESPLLDAQLIMARALKCSRLNIIAHPERELSEAESENFIGMLEKRTERYPLAYLLGSKEFYGLEIEVRPGVLIPRPETELLVEECLKCIRTANPIIADIGTGSGAIPIAICANLPGAQMYATEISDIAVEVARSNIEKHSLEERVSIVRGDLLEPLVHLNLEFDAIVSNPPYISTADLDTLQPEVRLYEPRGALDGGKDGLDAYRRLFPDCLKLLIDGGFLAVEIGIGEAGAVRKLAEQASYTRIEIIPDLAGIERVVVAYK